MVESGWAELSDGDEFAGYRIERRLGRGGMGILYLAVEPGLERRVALKLIAPEAASDEVFARRFGEESRIAASIEHPNVVPIYAAGEEDGIPYIAMRYVAGSDLGRRISRDGRLAPERAVALIAQIGNGLDAIHAAGLIHRDVKPANVLLSGEEGAEHAYITDFGVARNVSTQSGLTQTGRFVGTLDYVAPEQISGEAIDARVDVYALGCLLFKLLTGEVPFPREGEAARLYAHLNDPPPAPSLYVPAVPMALDDVVIRAMSKQPGDRFPSAGDLGRAAQAAFSGTTVAIAEHTVATGAAATVESDVVPRPGPTGPSVPEPVPPTTATRRDASDIDHSGVGSKSDAVSGGGAGGRKRLLIGGALAAVAAVVVLVIVLSSSGGGGDGRGSANAADTTVTTTSTDGKEPEDEKPKEKPRPQTLTREALISKGDAICTHSREAFLGYRDEFPTGETEPSVGYSQLLVGISTEAVSRFNELLPPRSVRREYDAYVASQEQVAKWDRDALAAAQAGDGAAYLAAREDRDSTEPERQQLAEAIGFHVCSGSNA
jgi:serine/threonine protein kinase